MYVNVFQERKFHFLYFKRAEYVHILYVYPVYTIDILAGQNVGLSDGNDMRV